MKHIRVFARSDRDRERCLADIHADIEMDGTSWRLTRNGEYLGTIWDADASVEITESNLGHRLVGRKEANAH